MSIYTLKSRFQDLLRPVSDTLVAQGATANQVTLAAVGLSAVIAHIIAHNHPTDTRCDPKRWAVLPVGLFVRMAMNAIDGMMAKEHKQASQLGAVLNEAGDIISDALLLASLAPHVADGMHCQLGRVMALTTISELVAIAATTSTGERANHGPLGKSDRAFALGILGAAVAVGYRPNHHQQKTLLSTAEILLLMTIYRRGWFILQNKSQAHR